MGEIRHRPVSGEGLVTGPLTDAQRDSEGEKVFSSVGSRLCNEDVELAVGHIYETLSVPKAVYKESGRG